MGINADLIPALRLFQNEERLQGVLGVVPQGQADASIMLTGDDSVESIYSEIAGSTNPDEVDPDDLVAAVNAPASQSMFHAVGDEQELANMLARPLAQWRTYLHQSQYHIAYKTTYNGPVRVTEGAGTGTVGMCV